MKSYKIDSCSCAECGEEFTSKKGLHSHLRKHAMKTSEYYEKNYPKKDIYNGKTIPFKTFEDYKKRFFVDKKSEFAFLRKNGYSGISKEILDSQIEKALERTSNRFPTQVEWRSYKNLSYDSIDDFPLFFSKHFKYGLSYFLHEELNPVGDSEILTDTREQKPLLTDNITSINVGDYTLEPKNYNGIHIDRKSLPDFISTFTSGLERFQRECDKAKAIGAYLVVLIEKSFNDCKNYMPPRYSKQKVRGSNAMAGARQIIRDNDNVQFLFVKDRKEAVNYIKVCLFNPSIVKRFDLQYLYDKGSF